MCNCNADYNNLTPQLKETAMTTTKYPITVKLVGGSKNNNKNSKENTNKNKNENNDSSSRSRGSIPPFRLVL